MANITVASKLLSNGYTVGVSGARIGRRYPILIRVSFVIHQKLRRIVMDGMADFYCSFSLSPILHYVVDFKSLPNKRLSQRNGSDTDL